MAPEIYPLPNFHLYVGVPAFVELAVKERLVPEQIVVAVGVTVIVGVTAGVTVIVTPVEVTVEGEAHARELVISTE